LPALGITLTPWEPKKEITLLFFITLISVLWVRVLISRTALKVWHVMCCGLLFLIYMFQVI
jgi:cation:H+ antiporter